MGKAHQAASTASANPSGEHWFAGANQQVIANLRDKRVFLTLKPVKFGFQITDALLETAHLIDHAEIGSADVAE
jgi:hypothetical protein